MGAKWFCNVCEKEIWMDLDNRKKRMSIKEAEDMCYCSSCLMAAYSNDKIEKEKCRRKSRRV